MPSRTAKISRWGACRLPRSPWWWNASWPFATSCRRTTCEVAGHVPAHRRAPEQRRLSRAPGFGSARGRRKERSAGHAAAAPTAKRPAQIVGARAHRRRRAIESIESETQRMPPPPLYDLTELQRHANRLFGFSAQKTLDLAQALYETPQADQLSAYRQPSPVPRCGAHSAAHRRRHRGALSRPTGARHRRTAAGPAVRGRFQGHRPPRHHPHHRFARWGVAQRPKSAGFTT